MAQAVALPWRLTRPEAAQRLQGGRLRRLLGAPRRLRGLHAVYVAYRLFRVSVTNRGREQVLWLALDSASGRLDPYRFDAPPEEAAPAEPGATLLPACVPTERLRERALECVRREVYQRGFFRLAQLRLAAEDSGREVRVPYWVGVLEQDGRAVVEVWNAVRRQREGAKLRELIEGWLAGGEAPAAVTPP